MLARSKGIDPVVVACHLGTALQSIVSRNISAQDTAVLSVTRIQAGDAYNVIPQHAVLAGTARTMKAEVMTLVEQNMKRLAVSIAEGFGAEAVVDFRTLFAAVENKAEEVVLYADAAAEVVGESNVWRDAPPSMASEDFGFMMQEVPGAHVMFGNGATASVHNQTYDFNDEAIPYGVALFAAITEKKLQKETAE